MASAGAIRAGRANVELGLDKTEFQRGLESIGRDLNGIGSKLAVGGTALAGFGAAILAPLGKAAKDFAALGDQLDKMSLRTGVAVEKLSALKFAAEQSGAGLEAVEKGLKGQARFAYDASRGLSTSVDVLDDLGLKMRDISGLDPAALFTKLGTAIGNVPDETTKAAIAMKVFGKAGADLLPLLKAGPDGIAALVQEAEHLGIVMSGADATAAAQLTDEMNRLSKTVEQVKLEIGSALAPLLTQLSAEKIRPLVKDVVDWTKKNSGLVITVAKIGTALAAVGAPLAALGVAVSTIGTALTAMSSAAGVAKVAMISLNAVPMVAAFTAISVAVLALTGKFDPLLDKIREYLGLQAQLPGDPNAPKPQNINPYATTPTEMAGNTKGNPLDKLTGIGAQVHGPSHTAQDLGNQLTMEALSSSRGTAPYTGPTRKKLSVEEFQRRFPGRPIPESISGEPKSSGRSSVLDAVTGIGNKLKVNLEFKKFQFDLGKEWAASFWKGMEERRQKIEQYTMDIASAQDAITDQKRSIAEQRDNADLVTGSAAAGVAGLGTTSVDQKQLEKLNAMYEELSKLRKEIAGER